MGFLLCIFIIAELASNGYVVISLDHPYHSFFTEDTDGKTITVNPNFMQEVMYINEDTTPEEEIFEISSSWFTIRTADIQFVLDTVKATKEEGACKEQWAITSEETKNRILEILAMADVEKIGLMGHSLGGAASVTVGRQRDILLLSSNNKHSFRNSENKPFLELFSFH